MFIQLAGQEVELLPQKAMFLPESRSLLIADMHVGKAMHFRKSGMPLPADASERDFNLLTTIIGTHAPREVIFLGDLFHSHQNTEWSALTSFMNQHAGIRFALVPGNHDRFSQRFSADSPLELLPEHYALGPFMLSHAPSEQPVPGYYQLCGHLHPGIALHGKGRMQVTLPCFWLGAHTGVLPAFGNLTGLALIAPRQEDQVVIIVDGSCIKLKA